MTNLSDVRIMASSLQDGDSLYTTCPSCGRPKKFSIRIDDGLVLYNCFRPACSLHGGGAFRINRGDFVRTKPAPPPKDTTFRGELCPLPEWMRDFLFHLYHLSEEQLAYAGAMFDPSDQRVCWPIRSITGKQRGWIRRAYYSTKLKSLTSPDPGVSHLSWYRRMDMPATHRLTVNDTAPLVIVEDVMSAVRASRYAHSLSLNGASLSLNNIQEVRSGSSNVIWALDKDATSKAIELHQRYRSMFNSSLVMMLAQDIKDMQESDLADLMRSYI